MSEIPPAMSSSRRPIPLLPILGCLLLIAVAALGWRILSAPGDQPLFAPDDFVEYWAAGRLIANGKNPYSPEELLPLQIAAGRDTDVAIMMWNPPWTLPVVMPFGMLPAKFAHLAWVLAGVVMILVTADRCWQMGGGSPDSCWVAWLLALTFLPSLFVLQAGQIGTFLTLGVAGVWHGLSRRDARVIGGAVFLLAIKPHLIYLLWPALLLWLVTDRSGLAWRAACWFGMTIAVALACTLWLNPQAVEQYVEATRIHTPTQWKSPTIASWLRQFFGPDLFGLQFVPMVAGGIWFLSILFHRITKTGLQPMDFLSLLLISFVTASYGAWPFDVVMLLPCVIVLATKLPSMSGWKARVMMLGYAGWTITGILMNQRGITSEYFVWMAPALLAFWTLGRAGNEATP